MKRIIAALLAALLLACLAANAGAEAPGEDMTDRFLGEWVGDAYRMYVRLDEEDGICARLTQVEGDCVWEFYRCLYDADEARLYAPNYTRYREYIDWDTMELVQEDWALGDLGLTWFAFADDDDVLIACEVPEVDEPITLSRVSEEEDFGF